MAMTRSLIIAPQWIGDAAMSEPLLRELHQRGEQLTVAALNWVAPVYQYMPSVAKVIELPFKHGSLQWTERRALARQWRGRFDRAYVMPNSLKSALIPWLAGIPLRIGYHGESRYVLLNQRLPNPTPENHPSMVPFYYALSGQPLVNKHLIRPVLTRDAATVEQTLQTFGLRKGAYIVMVPGVEYGPAKMWPMANVAGFCDLAQTQIVLLGSHKEVSLCQSVCELTRNPHVMNLAGQTQLSQAFDLLSAASAVISNDSGLCHVSAALGVPQVVVYGSTSPYHAPPLNPQAKSIWLGDDPCYSPKLDCAPCCERVCPLGHTRCMADVKPEQVLQSVQSLLSV
jgi:heptosyltransferase-2